MDWWIDLLQSLSVLATAGFGLLALRPKPKAQDASAALKSVRNSSFSRRTVTTDRTAVVGIIVGTALTLAIGGLENLLETRKNREERVLRLIEDGGRALRAHRDWENTIAIQKKASELSIDLGKSLKVQDEALGKTDQVVRQTKNLGNQAARNSQAFLRRVWQLDNRVDGGQAFVFLNEICSHENGAPDINGIFDDHSMLRIMIAPRDVDEDSAFHTIRANKYVFGLQDIFSMFESRASFIDDVNGTRTFQEFRRANSSPSYDSFDGWRNGSVYFYVQRNIEGRENIPKVILDKTKSQRPSGTMGCDASVHLKINGVTVGRGEGKVYIMPQFDEKWTISARGKVQIDNDKIPVYQDVTQIEFRTPNVPKDSMTK